MGASRPLKSILLPAYAGQIMEILVQEGDYVKAGQVLVYMDPDVLEAQLSEAQGKLLEAKAMSLQTKANSFKKRVKKQLQRPY